MKTSPDGFDYDSLDEEYPGHRVTDPRIARHLYEHLGDARSLLNVGAGTGSYEPDDRIVVAVEPSEVMRAHRPRNLVPAIAGSVEELPFDDDAFDSAMALLTVHHWEDLELGLGEVRRVTRGPIVVMTFDPEAETEFWLRDYVPEMTAVEMKRYGPIQRIADALGGAAIHSLNVGRDCRDAFQVALFARPEWFLRDEVRAAQSAWAHLPPGAEQRGMQELAADLESGEWDRKYGALRVREEITCQLRFVVSQHKR